MLYCFPGLSFLLVLSSLSTLPFLYCALRDHVRCKRFINTLLHDMTLQIKNERGEQGFTVLCSQDILSQARIVLAQAVEVSLVFCFYCYFLSCLIY